MTPGRDVITSGPDGQPRRRYRWPAVVVGLAAVVGVIAVQGGILPGRDGQHRRPPGQASSAPVRSPRATTTALPPLAKNAVVARIPLAIALYETSGIALGDEAVWVADWGGRRLLKVSTVTNRVVARRNLGDFYGSASSVAYGAGSVWLAGDGAVLRIDPRTLRTTARLRYSGYEARLAFGAGWLWLMSCCDQGGDATTLVRIDPRTNRTKSLRLPGADRGSFMLAGPYGVWTDGTFPDLVRLDPRSLGVVRQVPGGRSGGPAVLGEGAMWTVTGDARLLRIDEVAGERRVGPAGSGEGAQAIGAGPAGTFLATYDGRLLRIDENTLRPVAGGVVVNPPVPAWSRVLSTGSSGVWLATRGELVRVDPDQLPPMAGG